MKCGLPSEMEAFSAADCGLDRCLQEQGDTSFVDFYDAVVFHFFEFPGHGTAVYGQIISQIRHCEGQIKGVGFLPGGLLDKVTKQFFSNGAFGKQFYPFAQLQVFLGDDHQHILDQLMMAAACFRTWADDVGIVDEQDRTVCFTDDAYVFVYGIEGSQRGSEDILLVQMF